MIHSFLPKLHNPFISPRAHPLMSATFLAAAAERSRHLPLIGPMKRDATTLRDRATALLENDPLEQGAAVLVQTCSMHWDRVMVRMQEKHGAGVPVFVEQCCKGDTSTLLFRTTAVECLLAAVLRDAPLCRVLTRMPFIALHCGRSTTEVGSAFGAACRAAHARGDRLKLSAPASIRRSLLAAILSDTASATCLASSSETSTFHVASVYRSAAWLYGDAVPAWSWSCSASEATEAGEQALGHWHSSAVLDKSGSKLSVCPTLSRTPTRILTPNPYP